MTGLLHINTTLVNMKMPLLNKRQGFLCKSSFVEENMFVYWRCNPIIPVCVFWKSLLGFKELLLSGKETLLVVRLEV